MKKILIFLAFLFFCSTAQAQVVSFEDNIYSVLEKGNSQIPNGTIANISWGQLIQVPAGFADGTDDMGGGATTVIKTANQTTINATLFNVADMVFAVTSGNNYDIEFNCYFASNVTTNGLKLGVTYPAATRAGYTCYIPSAADGVSGQFQGWGTASADAITSTGVQAANTTYLAQVRMYITPSADGNVQLQYAGETANRTTIFFKSFGRIQTY